jgi:hypothetical protein
VIFTWPHKIPLEIEKGLDYGSEKQRKDIGGSELDLVHTLRSLD